METFKRIRKVQRTAVTRLTKQIEDFQLQPDFKIKLRALKNQLELKLQELDALDKNILNLIKDEEELDREMENAETYQYRILENISKITEIIQEEDRILEEKNSDNSQIKFTKPMTAKLPKLELKKFSGDIITWIPFWQIFQTTIDNRSELSEVEKLKYLVSLLDGEAAKTVAGFSLTAENYPDVIEILQKKYGNPEKTIDYHIQKILNIRPIREASNLPALRTSITELYTHLRSLKNLEVNHKQDNEVINAKIREIFPEEILLLYERHKGSKKRNTEEMMKFIDEEIRIREDVKPPTFLNPSAEVFKPRNLTSQQWRKPQRYTPRIEGNRHRPWIPPTPSSDPSTQPPQPNRSSLSNNTQKLCYRCGRAGHFARMCRSA